MKHILTLSLFLCGHLLFCQPNTDIYIADLLAEGNSIEAVNLYNLSKNKGYDNQPSFFKNNQLIYASTRNGQTDIALKVLGEINTVWITDTPNGSEYSPVRVPTKNAISSIRLDTDGLQRLYEYDLSTGKAEPILEHAKIGYHVWYTKEILVATVLNKNRMDLIIANIRENTLDTIYKNVGRSLHKIPNSELVGFVVKDDGKSVLNSIHPINRKITKIIDLANKSEDVCWLNDGTLLTGYGSMILKYSPNKDTNWVGMANFHDQNITNISRLAVNAANTKLALVAEESPVTIVQRQVETFNARDLDAFINNYSNTVLVQNFPNDTICVGSKKMKERYRQFYAKTPKIKVSVESRIVIGSTVIDKELVTIANRSHHQIAIYKVENGRISSMTFIHDNRADADVEKVVQDQLDAYNARNIKDFLKTFTNDVTVYNFPHELQFGGLDKMEEQYGSFFEATPDLNCEIKNRMVIGNKVIDEEFITLNGGNFSAVAIYEVENDKITKVTFIH